MSLSPAPAREPEPEPEFFTTAEIAHRLRVSPETVRAWRKVKNKGRARVPRGWVRVGRQSLLPAARLHEFERQLLDESK